MSQETIAEQQIRICELESTLDQHGTISNTSDNLAKSAVVPHTNAESSVIVDLQHQIQLLMVGTDRETLDIRHFSYACPQFLGTSRCIKARERNT